MINELFDIGIQDPTVFGILVMHDVLYLYTMHLGGPKAYILTELPSTPMANSAGNLVLIPSIVSKLVLFHIHLGFVYRYDRKNS
ncbi:hypothetical protein BY458DRAFT_510414 [Sporodiniella umbellata]|nr:hypothetical protein BY458DRAFT_510414 [Sporodiniella umbellata]